MATINHKTYNEGTETFKDFSVYDGKDTLIFKVDGSSGGVGIGTTAAVGKLTVQAIGADGIVIESDPLSVNNSGRLFFKSTIQTFALFNNSGDLRFTYDAGVGSTSGTSLARFANTGKYFRMEVGTGGIQFNGDTLAANALDDYEEGTWSPVITDLTNNATMISGTTGFYTKIGRQVTLSAYVRTTSIGSVSGDVYIAGMPFTSNGSLGSETSVTFGYFTGMNLGAAGVSVGAYIQPATTRMALYINDAATGITAMQGSEWGNTGYVHLGITYFV